MLEWDKSKLLCKCVSEAFIMDHGRSGKASTKNQDLSCHPTEKGNPSIEIERSDSSSNSIMKVRWRGVMENEAFG